MGFGCFENTRPSGHFVYRRRLEMNIVQCLLFATIHSSFQLQELLRSTIDVTYSIDLLWRANVSVNFEKRTSHRHTSEFIHCNFTGSSGSGACLSTNPYPHSSCLILRDD